MAETNPTKRARANSAGDSNVQKALDLKQVQMMVEEDLDKEAIVRILTKAIHAHPDIARMVVDEVSEIKERECNRVIDFDCHSQSVWKSINNTKGMSGSRQFEKSFEVISSISSTIAKITAQCGELVSPDTRYNGLFALCEIGESIVDSAPNTLSSEVRKGFSTDPILSDSMQQIISAMEPEERQSIRQDVLWSKLEGLIKLCRSYCVFKTLPDVLDLIKGKSADDSENDVLILSSQ
ncbi:hypothetical protein N7490_003718 [Penicillium lividum]|nr:hypothetical protein N7490_003718 [Penicillium lividum]